MPPELESQSVEKKIKFRKWILVLAITMVILVAAFVYRFNLKDMAGCRIMFNDCYLENVQNSKNNLDEFADWQTYRNEEYGFEFKYPNEYAVFADIPNTIQIISPEDKNSANDGPKNQILIKIKDNLEGLNVNDWWDKYGIRPDTSYAENRIINGIDGIYIGGSEGVLTNYLILPMGNKMLEILDMMPQSKILSTFKFISTSTPEAVDVSNWKTYTNTKWKYEFKYPDNVGVVSEYDSSFLGPPTNMEEDLLLISDKEKTFYFQVIDGKLSVIKKSFLGDQILSTFKFIK